MKISTYTLYLLLAALPLPIFAQTADFTYTSTSNIYCHPYRIVFKQQCTGNPQAYVWDFGNGQRGLNPEELVVYDTSGTFTVTLTAVYANTAQTVSKTITINQTPVAMLRVDKSQLCAPGTVSFAVDGSTNITRYEWDFGDNTIENEGGRLMQHAYTGYGTFTANVKVSTAAGCTAQSSYTININKFGLTATVIPNNGCIPAIATLGVSTSLPAGDVPVNYQWVFGDGSMATSTDSSINHTYNTTDSIINANVTVTTAAGCSNQLTFAPFAYGRPPVNTTIKTQLIIDTFCASERIKFIGQAPDANVYKWQFGDSTENTSSNTIIDYKYRSLGNKKVIVTPSLNGCEGDKDSMVVFIKGVIADFTYGNQCNRKNDYWFANGSRGNITAFKWLFSGQTPVIDSLNFDASHLFPAQGSFKASLSLHDNTTGCSDETTYNIYTAVPVLNRDISSVCKDSLINYVVSSTYPDSAGFTYTYYVCGDTVSNNSATLNYNPVKHGSFTDYVVIEDAVPGTCSDTLRFNNNTIVKGPVTNFTTADRACTGKIWNLANNSYPFYASDAINTWQWSFGDSTFSNVKDPAPYNYKKAAVYTIKLTATDINGCAASFEKAISSDRLPQVIAFPSRDTICSGRDTVVLRAYTIDSLMWLPATNISCNNCDTAFAYPTENTFYVARAKNYFGCLSYDTVEIKVFKPFQAKIFPADTSICPGQPVNFRLNTGGIVSWQTTAWLSQTNIANPVAKPLSDTSYSVIVKDSAGCFTDSATAIINVYDLPSVNAGPDKLLPYNEAFSLTPAYSSGIVSYTWSPAKGLNCNTCPTPSGIAEQPGKYTITVTNTNGCTAKDEVGIFIECNKANLLMPTAFSPNGNGINEYFYPIARGYKNIRKFVIFNRLGNKVFEKQNFLPNNPASGWDGIIRGAETTSSTETFVWFIEAECQQGELVQSKGTVTLVR